MLAYQIDRIAALAPPARTHRHRYFGVLAPHSPLRAAVTALAQAVPVRIRPSPGSSKCRYSRCAWCSPAACTRTRQVLPGALPLGGADARNYEAFTGERETGDRIGFAPG